MKKNFSLSALEEYAKCITKKLSEMLYEKKSGKTYHEHLDEVYRRENGYNMYLDNYIMDKNNMTRIHILSECAKGLDYSETRSGIYIYADNHIAYEQLCERLMDEGMNHTDLYNSIDNRYKDYMKRKMSL